jgi:hypothetical protein
MREILLFLLLCAIPFTAPAQKDGKAIKDVINRFVDGMEKRDSAMVRSTFTEKPLLQTYTANPKGEMQIVTTNYEAFLTFLATPSDDTFKERIRFGTIEYEEDIASVWTVYTFYLNGKVLHCGTNTFQLVKTAEGWKIQYILDSRRSKGCGRI